MKKAKRLVEVLKKQSMTIALAESMTCGLAAYKLSKVPDVSDVLKGSIICYHESSKTELLSVPAKLIKHYTAESKQVTDALARKLSQKLTADIYGAITGLASPGGSETASKPVGTVFFSVVFKSDLYHHVHHFRGTPEEIREKACEKMYAFILSIVSRKKSKRKSTV